MHVVVLHPSYKLDYFKNAGWEAAWIKAAEDILRAEYDRVYHFREDLSGDITSTAAGPEVCYC